jgi:hypothetical protein
VSIDVRILTSLAFEHREAFAVSSAMKQRRTLAKLRVQDVV